MRIVGVMPMAGQGVRLGLPFHKALLPTFTPDGEMKLLWQYAYERLAVVTSEIVTVVSEQGASDPCMRGVPNMLVKTHGRESPTSIALAASHFPGTWLAMVFPDTIWYPQNGLAKAVAALSSDIDGVLLDFMAPGNVLDRVILDADGYVDRIIQKRKDDHAIGLGWGAFIVRSDIAVDWSDDIFISDNLEAMRLRSVTVSGPYDDLGTPEQYRRALCR